MTETLALRTPVWKVPAAPAAGGLMARAVAAGVLASSVALAPRAGAGVVVGAVAVVAAIWPSTRGSRTPALLAWGAVALMLTSTALVRDASWLVALNMMGALGAASVALARPRSLIAHIVAAGALVSAGCRAVPWVAAGIETVARRQRVSRPWMRAIAAAIALLVVFGALYASADRVFGRLVGAVLLDPTDISVPHIGVFLAGVALVTGAAYVLASPPNYEHVIGRPRTAPTRVEWVLPLAALVTMGVVFVGVQLRTVLAGESFVMRTAGLTYAEYARTGFFQLLATAALTLAVIAVAWWRVPRSGSDARLLKALLASLCLVTLGVLFSAASRLALYNSVYGLTRLRLVVAFAIAWIASLFVLLLIAGFVRSAGWLPTAVAISVTAALVVLTAVNPDARIAESQVQRNAAAGTSDFRVLEGLSADAVPALMALPADARTCILGAIAQRLPVDAGWTGANLSRARAADALRAAGVTRAPQRPYCGRY